MPPYIASDSVPVLSPKFHDNQVVGMSSGRLYAGTTRRDLWPMGPDQSQGKWSLSIGQIFLIALNIRKHQTSKVPFQFWNSDRLHTGKTQTLEVPIQIVKFWLAEHRGNKFFEANLLMNEAFASTLRDGAYTSPTCRLHLVWVTCRQHVGYLVYQCVGYMCRRYSEIIR